MNIMFKDFDGKTSFMTNENLEIGDKVFPMVKGMNKDNKYYVCSIADYKDALMLKACTGWPDDPHTILDLNHSDDKSYQIRTNYGYGPVEQYFKVIK